MPSRIAARKRHRKKLRLDLYDRRFEIFTSIFPFYYAMMSWEGTPEHEEARQRFFRAYQESLFLFKKESGIADLLKKLNDDGGGPETITQELWLQTRFTIGTVLVLVGTAFQIYGSRPK